MHIQRNTTQEPLLVTDAFAKTCKMQTVKPGAGQVRSGQSLYLPTLCR
jgi:hypothetical protein